MAGIEPVFSSIKPNHQYSNSRVAHNYTPRCFRKALILGAREGTRTPISFLTSGPKPGASTNFATLAITE
jgi:hypothetical protein